MGVCEGGGGGRGYKRLLGEDHFFDRVLKGKRSLLGSLKEGLFLVGEQHVQRHGGEEGLARVGKGQWFHLVRGQGTRVV